MINEDKLSIIHPISFFDNTVLQSPDIGNPEVYPILQELQHMSTNGSNNVIDILKDFIINNVLNLSNTFIIKLLEDYVDKDEIAYLVDFFDKYDLVLHLSNTLNSNVLATQDEVAISNLIESNIVFTINQFIQFYTVYKIVYNKEGVDLYRFLYKETYEKYPNKEIKVQDKYVFCSTILSNMLEGLIPHICYCCEALRKPILNIKTLSKEVTKNNG
jgi:hypothetical protein